MTTEYTQNFRLALPDFRMGPWHDLVNGNTVTIDALMMSVLQGVDTRPWTNNTIFDVGMTAIDTADNTFWVCSVTHTSAPEPTTFAEDRIDNPTYWARVVVGIAPRGEWANSTHYLPNDMVNDSNEGVIAVCNAEHTSSPVPATIRTDEIYWSFIADMGAGGSAIGILYDNTVSGVAADNVQEALDLTFANDAQDAADIDNLFAQLSALTTRVTNTETVNTTQNTNINNNALAVSNLDLRVTTLENAGFIGDSPADGTIYGRRNHAWLAVPTGTPGIPEAPNDAKSYGRKSLAWAEVTPEAPNDTKLYGRKSLGWTEITATILGINSGSLGAVSYTTAQGLTAAQQLQARTNIESAPFNAIGAMNLAVNGGCVIFQTFPVNSTAPMVSGSTYNFADQFFQTFQNATAVVTGYNGAQAGSPGLTPPPGFTNAMFAYLPTAIPVSMANGDYLFFGQKIEGTRIAKMAWGTASAQPLTYAFMVQVMNDAPGVGFLKVANHDNTRCYYAEFAVAGVGWTLVTGTIPGDTAGTWRIDNNAALNASIWFAGKSAAPATPGVWGSTNTFQTTNSTNLCKTNTTTIGLTGLLLVPGQHVIPNAQMLAKCMRPFAEEYLACLRYLNVVKGQPYPTACGAGLMYNTTLGLIHYQFPVAMRAAPLFSMVLGNWGVIANANVLPVSSYLLGGAGSLSARLDLTTSIAGVAGQGALLASVDVSASMTFDARM